MNMSGYVYVLSNESMPGIVKIGRSINGGRNRAYEIYRGATGVPTPFKMEFEIWSCDCVGSEALVHEHLKGERVSPDREFFKCEVDYAIEAVVSIVVSDYDLSVLPADMAIDPAYFHFLSYEIERLTGDYVHIAELASSLDLITTQEMIGFVNRRREKLAKEKPELAKNNKYLSRLKIVGND